MEARILNAVAGIVFSRKEGTLLFLMLKKQGVWTGWQFVQGEIDKGESAEDAVIREIKEETGLKSIEIIKKLDEKYDYWFMWEGENVHKFLTFFTVKADMKEPVSLSEEHSEYRWVDADEAVKMLRFNKEIFKKAAEDIGRQK